MPISWRSAGCKRVLISDDYYPVLQRDNVELVTDAVREVRPHAIVTADGTERAVDTIIFATGFHVTDAPIAARIHDEQGVSLAGHWADGMSALRGTTVPGFPNLFLVAGPNTGLGHTSMVYMIESQLAYISDAIRTMDACGLATIEASEQATVASTPAYRPGSRGPCGTPAGAAAGISTRRDATARCGPTSPSGSGARPGGWIGEFVTTPARVVSAELARDGRGIR